MDKAENKKLVKTVSRKTIFGIKLPPIEASDYDKVKTIIDIDPDFYSLVEGRPIRPSTSISKYKQDIKEVALKRTLHGFITDEILRIDREMETEKDIYETALKHFEECQNSFDKFLAYDNNKTIDIMRKSDTMSKDLWHQTEEHKKANYELASLKSKLQYIDESLQILLSYENFLHKAAPILWQQKENVDLNVKHTEIFTMDTVIFRKIDIDLLKKKLADLSAPRLYFETPEQLLTIFNLLEKQNVNYLLLTEELNFEKNKFLKTAEQLKTLLKQELNYIQQKINEIEQMIVWNSVREEEVKEVFFRILQEKIGYLVSSEMVLKIFNYVEYAYEKLISSNEINLSTIEMVSAIKNEYEDLMMDLSTLDLDTVKIIEKETYEIELKEMKQAKKASKLLKDVEKMSRRLKSSYEPSRRKTFG